MREFEQAYMQLNAAQRQAVDTIDGPVLVIAGPGTGKTQLLSTRVANILRKTDTDASSILCLTFTNKAATNMRDRLLALIGSSSHNVMVKTFHSFAIEVMNTYPDYFWNGAQLSTAPDTVQLEIIQDVLAHLPLNNPLALKFAGTYTKINDVQVALKLAKEAGLTPDKLRAIIRSNMAYIELIEERIAGSLLSPLSVKNLVGLEKKIEALPDQAIDDTITPLISLSTVIKASLRQALNLDEGTSKTVHTSKWKRRWLQTIENKKGMFDERTRNQWWLALADVYELYRDSMHQRNYYDYADMIVEVIAQLEQHPELRASIQEQFLYVLIDEFQDTNAAQLRLAHLVADHHTSEGKPNLMAVGDDDQTIFAFNGAELNNMLSFRRTYPAAKVIVLEDNYRSTQPILDTAKGIIEQAETRLVTHEADISKNLKSVQLSAQKGVISHVAYPTREHQLTAVAKNIQTLWKQADQSIAVLARGHDSLRQLAHVLLKLNVPVNYEQQTNILEHETVVQACLLAELSVAINQGDEQLVNQTLSKLLHHPMWKIDAEELWHLAITNYAEPHWLESLLKSDQPKLRLLGQWFVWLAEQANFQPLALLLEYILGLREGEYLRSPLQQYFIAQQPLSNSYLETLSAIQILQTLADEFAFNTKASLDDFVKFIYLNRVNHKIIADESWFISHEKAVQLLTVHKAKGLEFDIVLVIDAIEDNWRPRKTGRKPPANLPLQPYGDTYDDYVRLLYVAATRARHTLLINSYYTDFAGKTLLATPLLHDGFSTTTIKPDKNDQSIELLENAVAWPRLETTDEKALLSERLKNFSLSTTSLLNFLDVSHGGPQHFFTRNLLRLPEAKTPALAFGTAVHAALEQAQKLTNSHHFDIQKILSYYKAALHNEHLRVDDFERYLVHGQNVLKQLFKNPSFVLPVGSLAEQKIEGVHLSSATINGKLDRVDLVDKKQLTIVDYKTGAPLISLTTKNQQQAIKAWKHRTQLVFYSLLAQQSSRFKRFSSLEGQILYIEAESAASLIRPYSPNPEERARLTQLIEIVWQHIMRLDFPVTHHYSPDFKGVSAFEDDLLNGRL